MKASEARQIATDIHLSKIAKEYNEIISKVSQKAKSGNFKIVYDGSLESETIEKLRLDGYTVRNYQSGMNEYSYEISW